MCSCRLPSPRTVNSMKQPVFERSDAVRRHLCVGCIRGRTEVDSVRAKESSGRAAAASGPPIVAEVP